MRQHFKSTVLITTAIRTTMDTAVSRQLQYLRVWLQLQLQRYGLPRRLRLMRDRPIHAREGRWRCANISKARQTLR